jgi:hypothetical protein
MDVDTTWELAGTDVVVTGNVTGAPAGASCQAWVAINPGTFVMVRAFDPDVFNFDSEIVLATSGSATGQAYMRVVSPQGELLKQGDTTSII